jgi:hypothetical protein
MPQRCLATAIVAFHTRFDSERYTATAADEKRRPPDAKPLL